jgi:hypothetical protein
MDKLAQLAWTLFSLTFRGESDLLNLIFDQLKSMNNKEDKSPHILNASSNLLGLCFVVLTSLKLLNISHRTVIDELTTVAIILFMASCMLSFLSIRGNISKSGKFENIADYLFITGICLIFLTTIFFSFNIIK